MPLKAQRSPGTSGTLTYWEWKHQEMDNAREGSCRWKWTHLWTKALEASAVPPPLLPTNSGLHSFSQTRAHLHASSLSPLTPSLTRHTCLSKDYHWALLTIYFLHGPPLRSFSDAGTEREEAPSLCLAGIEPACLPRVSHSGCEGCLWAKGLQVTARGPGLLPCLHYFSTGTHFPYSPGCFCAATMEMSSCNRDIRVHRAKTVYKLVLCRKSLLTPFWGAAKLPLDLLDKHEEEDQSQAPQSISCGQHSDRCCGNVHSPVALCLLII